MKVELEEYVCRPRPSPLQPQRRSDTELTAESVIGMPERFYKHQVNIATADKKETHKLRERRWRFSAAGDGCNLRHWFCGLTFEQPKRWLKLSVAPSARLRWSPLEIASPPFREEDHEHRKNRHRGEDGMAMAAECCGRVWGGDRRNTACTARGEDLRAEVAWCAPAH